MYPQATPVRITLRLRNGRSVSREQHDFEGAPSRPLTWQRTVQKFHWLATSHADDALRGRIIDTVAHLDETRVSVLTELLTDVCAERRKELS
jgi:2-methylcitrate dehydratase